MRIIFDKVHLKNFLSFEDTELDLNNNGYVLVDGINENPDDLARSNGSGKSSLFEAIVWCLTGETVRGTKEVKRLNSTDMCSVELDFSVNGIPYKIIRTKEPSNLKVFFDGKDASGKGIRDTEKLLEEYLPDLTAQLLGSVVILGQGLPQRFTNNTPSGRKEVLEKLSKSDFMIEDLKRRINDRKNTLSNELRGVEDFELSTKARIDVLEKQVNNDVLKLSTMSSDDISNKINNYLSDKKEQETLLNSSNDLLSDVDKELVLLQNDFQVINEKYDTLIKEKEKEYDDILSKSWDDITVNKTLYDSLEDEIRRLDKVVDVCPTCGQKLPGVQKVDTSSQKQRLSSLNDTLKKQKEDYDRVSLEKQNSIRELKNGLAVELQPLNEKKDGLERNKHVCSEQIRICSTNINQLDTYLAVCKKDLDNFELNKKDLEDRISNSRNEQESLQNDLMHNEIEKEKISRHLDIVNKMVTAVTRDFRGYLLTNVINFINSKSKEYSKEVFETDKIDFKLDGNNISISYDNKEYENLSGGEKQKVDLIVQLSIRDMLCSFLDFSSNILVLDELFDNLDDVGCQRVLNLISSKIHDVESIYVVTHHADISIPVDSEIIVVKGEDKISRIRR